MLKRRRHGLGGSGKERKSQSVFQQIMNYTDDYKHGRTATLEGATGGSGGVMEGTGWVEMMESPQKETLNRLCDVLMWRWSRAWVGG